MRIPEIVKLDESNYSSNFVRAGPGPRDEIWMIKDVMQAYLICPFSPRTESVVESAAKAVTVYCACPAPGVFQIATPLSGRAKGEQFDVAHHGTFLRHLLKASLDQLVIPTPYIPTHFDASARLRRPLYRRLTRLACGDSLFHNVPVQEASSSIEFQEWSPFTAWASSTLVLAKCATLCQVGPLFAFITHLV